MSTKYVQFGTYQDTLHFPFACPQAKYRTLQVNFNFTTSKFHLPTSYKTPLFWIHQLYLASMRISMSKSLINFLGLNSQNPHKCSPLSVNNTHFYILSNITSRYFCQISNIFIQSQNDVSIWDNTFHFPWYITSYDFSWPHTIPNWQALACDFLRKIFGYFIIFLPNATQRSPWLSMEDIYNMSYFSALLR